MCGRGGETNHHAGNIRYRQLVKICQPAYIAAKRREKPKIAQRIVRAVRLLGGRFLKKVPEDNCWTDVGNVKAREKTSQALREGAPELRTGKEDERPKKRKSCASPTSSSSNNNSNNSKPQEVPPPATHMMHAVMMPHLYVEVPSAAMGSMPYHAAPMLSSQPQQQVGEQYKKCRISDNSETPQVAKSAPAAVVTNERNSTPTSFTATVSADDDDGTNSTGASQGTARPHTPGQGPRLKLLKRRLQAAA